jgi:hypothetical protein
MPLRANDTAGPVSASSLASCGARGGAPRTPGVSDSMPLKSSTCVRSGATHRVARPAFVSPMKRVGPQMWTSAQWVARHANPCHSLSAVRQRQARNRPHQERRLFRRGSRPAGWSRAYVPSSRSPSRESVAGSIASSFPATGRAAESAGVQRAQLFGLTRRKTGRDRTLALIFDDGPNPAVTPQLLDLLERYDAHARPSS